MTYVE